MKKIYFSIMLLICVSLIGCQEEDPLKLSYGTFKYEAFSFTDHETCSNCHIDGKPEMLDFIWCNQSREMTDIASNYIAYIGDEIVLSKDKLMLTGIYNEEINYKSDDLVGGSSNLSFRNNEFPEYFRLGDTKLFELKDFRSCENKVVSYTITFNIYRTNGKLINEGYQAFSIKLKYINTLN